MALAWSSSHFAPFLRRHVASGTCPALASHCRTNPTPLFCCGTLSSSRSSYLNASLLPISPDTVSDFGSFALTNPSKAPIYGSSRRLYLSGRLHNGGSRRKERRDRELCSQAGQDRLRPLKWSRICAWNPRRHCCRHDGRRVTSDQKGLVCLLQD